MQFVEKISYLFKESEVIIPDGFDIETLPEISHPEKAIQKINFIQRLCTHIKGRWAGKPFRLIPWQFELVWILFGSCKKNGFRQYRFCFAEVPKKNGKALSIDTKIPTPDGWKKMEHMSEGDIVFDEKGNQCSVVAVSDIMYDRPCYNIRFSDGIEIVADKDHMWQTTAFKLNENGNKGSNKRPKLRNSRGYAVFSLHNKVYYVSRWDDPIRDSKFKNMVDSIIKKNPLRKNYTDIRTTEEIKNTIRYDTNYNIKNNMVSWNHKIRITKPLDIDDIELPIPPYTLGAWLGDGSSYNASVHIAYNDIEIIENIIEDGISIKEWKNGKDNLGHFSIGSNGKSQKGRNKSLATKIRKLGLFQNKHIPKVYLRAGTKQRMSLLQGLMDTDGHASTYGQCEFTTVTKKIFQGIIELIRSLGIKPTYSIERATINGRDCGIKYRVRFFAYQENNVFRLSRKAKRLKPWPKKETRAFHRHIVSIERVESVPVKCISVDSKSNLYLCSEGMIPTHNTELAAAIALSMLCGDGEKGGEVYSAAVDRDQASLVYSPAEQMVKNNSILSKKLKIINSRKRIVYHKTESIYVALSADVAKAHGYNPSCVIFDEVHAYPNDDLYRVLTMETDAARDQQLVLIITTAGVYDKTSLWWKLRSYAKNVRDGIIKDDSFFPILYISEKDKDDPEDRELWKNVNPSLGYILEMEKLERSFAKAKQDPIDYIDWLRYRLNMPVAQAVKWMPMDEFDVCEGDINLESLEGRKCVGGIDLSSSRDLTCYCLLFFPESEEDPKWIVYPRFYCPSANIMDRSKKDNVPYHIWKEQGFITATPGNVIDYGFIENDVIESSKKYDLLEVGFDPWKCTDIATRLFNDHGVNMVEMRQGSKTLSEPMKNLLQKVLKKQIVWDNPILRWNADNLVAKKDSNDNVTPDKQRSKERIDGMSALIMANGRAMFHGKVKDEGYGNVGRKVIAI